MPRPRQRRPREQGAGNRCWFKQDRTHIESERLWTAVGAAEVEAAGRGRAEGAQGWLSLGECSKFYQLRGLDGSVWVAKGRGKIEGINNSKNGNERHLLGSS